MGKVRSRRQGRACRQKKRWLRLAFYHLEEGHPIAGAVSRQNGKIGVHNRLVALAKGLPNSFGGRIGRAGSASISVGHITGVNQEHIMSYHSSAILIMGCSLSAIYPEACRKARYHGVEKRDAGAATEMYGILIVSAAAGTSLFYGP